MTNGLIIIEPEGRVSIEDDLLQHQFCTFLVDIWRRIRMELTIEFPMLKSRWKTILFGAIFQYVHGIFTQLEKRLHEPQEKPLGDIGFQLMHELGRDKAWISESIFYTLFLSFILWTLSPFVLARKRFYTVVLVSRLLLVLAACQSLRIVSFLSTQLPAPNYHCRLGEPSATMAWPDHWYEHLVFDPERQAAYGCGDLIFSSHTTFILVGVLTYTTYGSFLIIKIVVWILGAILSLLIIASRKHYTVDVVVAWYTVPLVFYTFYRRWTTRREMGDADSAQQETRSREDDAESKSETNQLLEEFSEGNGGQATTSEINAPSNSDHRTSIEMQMIEEGGGLMCSGTSAPEFKERPTSSTLNAKSRSAPRLDRL
eukprot:g5582.t1